MLSTMYTMQFDTAWLSVSDAYTCSSVVRCRFWVMASSASTPMSYHIIWYDFISYHTIVYYTISNCSSTCFIILYYSIPCIVLCYVILYHIVIHHILLHLPTLHPARLLQATYMYMCTYMYKYIYIYIYTYMYMFVCMYTVQRPPCERLPIAPGGSLFPTQLLNASLFPISSYLLF